MLPRSQVIPSIKTSLVVGAVLTLLNQWTIIARGPHDAALAAHAVMNCLVPFFVSLYSRWSAARKDYAALSATSTGPT